MVFIIYFINNINYIKLFMNIFAAFGYISFPFSHIGKYEGFCICVHERY